MIHGSLVVCGCAEVLSPFLPGTHFRSLRVVRLVSPGLVFLTELPRQRRRANRRCAQRGAHSSLRQNRHAWMPTFHSIMPIIERRRELDGSIAARRIPNAKWRLLAAFCAWLVSSPVATLAARAGLPPKDPAPPEVLRFIPKQELPIEVYRGVVRQLEYEVVNESGRALRLLSIFPRKGEGSGRAEPQTLQPGSKGRLILDYHFPEALGKDQVNFLVKTDDESVQTQIIRIPYFVQAAYEPEFAVLDFGDIHTGQRLQTRLEVSSRLVSTLSFKKVISKPAWLDVTFDSAENGSAQTVGVVATTREVPDFGLNVGEVVLESNVAQDPHLKIPVLIRSFSKYRISPIPVSLGGVPEGQDRKVTLRVNRIGDGEVHLADIEPGSLSLKVDSSACGKGCLDLHVSFDSMKARRSLRTIMKIKFADDDVPLQVPIDALVVPIGIKMTDLGNLDEITVKSKTTELKVQ